ncbi:tRNA (adenosine(37)-N6)-threonylcarbamoyltransferase complex ATPase subunit type 1 TsaE [Salinisphaera sp.]|uniref:tRNA (adenosine(37)-N6)-threonylcarbamoyltransferase complex ATPase subunit type 1 TsaE n=1 Tax=Salinisphaera sp. TaxID=1914330 RepID=UPI002D79E7E1|nr:tRNA (adenosine(37)-N6)-threonylcarbamoyltransferase complex ATPase subunit type 1 TsaE [Salinisphaera sp.]HET7314639.1 tRNA (adenosine(37)-N6)-threonylcarbamoyltransferase complex ATPase subunit type 1 TsaE [Salinisphaera sp.]
MNITLATPAATEALGRDLARVLELREDGVLITLAGELGAGKTALVRAIIQALGHAGPVVSPSYTLVEPYEFGARRLYHLDLYRLADPEELEFLGVREISAGSHLVFVEWAERGAGFLPPADMAITLEYNGAGRSARLAPCSAAGRDLIAKLQDFRSRT